MPSELDIVDQSFVWRRSMQFDLIDRHFGSSQGVLHIRSAVQVPSTGHFSHDESIYGRVLYSRENLHPQWKPSS